MGLAEGGELSETTAPRKSAVISPHAEVLRASLRRRAFGRRGAGKAIAMLDTAVAQDAAIGRTDTALVE